MSLRQILYSRQSICFWNRYNVAWPFRSEPSNGRTVPMTPVRSVRGLQYQETELLSNTITVFHYRSNYWALHTVRCCKGTIKKKTKTRIIMGNANSNSSSAKVRQFRTRIAKNIALLIQPIGINRSWDTMLAFVTLLTLHAPYIMTVLAYKYSTTLAATSGTKKTVAVWQVIKNKYR